MSEIKAAFLDIDHTLINGKGEFHDGLAEVLDPGNRPFRLTHLTARTPATYAHILLHNPAIVPDQGMPVGLEYGTRIVHAADYSQADTYETLTKSPLSDNDLASIVHMASISRGSKRIAFAAGNNKEPRIVWNSDQADIHTLELLLDLHQPGLVSYKLPATQRRPEQLDGLHTYTYRYDRTMSVDIIPRNAGKRQAALRMMTMCRLDPSEVLIAGDSPADYGMLAIEGIRAVLVHSEKTDLATAPQGLTPIPPEMVVHNLR